jgi:DNA-3-methyladenine glycosylase
MGLWLISHFYCQDAVHLKLFMDSITQFLSHPAEEVAPKLLGCTLERKIDDKIIRVKIVETEAYTQTDAASHSYKGRTPRTNVMFEPAGYVYVYFTYGMHYCCNIVTDREGEGSAVLIRAVEPLEGEELMASRRNKTGVSVCNGPGKLCQALAITKELNGHNLQQAPLKLKLEKPLDNNLITRTTRIGISRAVEMPWRFYITGNPYVSKK